MIVLENYAGSSWELYHLRGGPVASMDDIRMPPGALNQGIDQPSGMLRVLHSGQTHFVPIGLLGVFWKRKEDAVATVV